MPNFPITALRKLGQFAFYKKGARALFFIGVLLCLLPASRGTDFFFWWLELCVLSALIGLQQEQVFALSWLSVALAGFCGLLLTNALYLNPVYHAEGIYFPITLLLAFVAASHCPVWFAQTSFKLFCVFIVLIATWALLQWLTGWGFIDEKSSRAQALFITPNTLATALNLGLVPILGYYLLGRGGRGVYRLTLLLFAALLATQSRGGYLGLLAYIGIAWRGLCSRVRPTTTGGKALSGGIRGLPNPSPSYWKKAPHFLAKGLKLTRLKSIICWRKSRCIGSMACSLNNRPPIRTS